MSAIFGIYYLDGRPVPAEALQRMSDVLAHRGSDATGLWCQDSLGFGSRLLWTTPQSQHEQLPSRDFSCNRVITADARLDNREELWSALGMSGKLTDEVPDSQLILAAYGKWGEKSPFHLLGDFAFAIWDHEKRSVFCARDAFGVKPFFYHLSDKVFVFASEIMGILALPEVSREINEVKIGDSLINYVNDANITFFKDVLKLPAAHSMVIGVDLPKRLQAYWALDPTRELKLASDQEYVEAFRELFFNAVKVRLVSKYSVGSFLSGGLDSSSVACVASHLLSQSGGMPLSTYSAIFDEVKECDEREYIHSVIAQNGVRPTFIHGDRLNPFYNHDKTHWRLDAPHHAFNLYLNLNIYEAAGKQGVRVTLDGFDGDSTISHGTGFFREMALKGNWLNLFTELRHWAKYHDVNPYQNFWRLLWGYGLRPRMPKMFINGLSSLRRSMTGRSPVDEVPWVEKMLNPEFVKRIGLMDRFFSMEQHSKVTSHREFHYQRLTWPLIMDTLEVLDRSAAAFGVEPRYPFWDRRLAEFCLAMPGQCKLNQGLTRVVMRRALTGILPEKIRMRPGKTNMGPNFNRIFRNVGGVHVNEVLDSNIKYIKNYVTFPILDDLYQRFKLDHLSEEEIMLFWKIITLGEWIQAIPAIAS